jgi:transposase
MFIRKKPNKSGTISVQIIKKVSRSNRIVKTIGCGTTAEELEALERRARTELEMLRPQLSFSFDMSDREMSVVELVKTCRVYAVGPELILGKIFDHLGFSFIPDELFKDIVLARLVYPTSKLRTTEYLRQHTGKNVQVARIYRFLDRLGCQYKEEVERLSFNYTKRVLGDVVVAFYDMTSLYFEAEREDDLRRIGFSKDGKFQHPQIMLGLLVGIDGYPISYDIYEGNTFEGDTLIPALKKVQDRFGLTRPTVIADSALLSRKNLNALDEEGYQYIIGARIKNEDSETKAKILQLGARLNNRECTVFKRKDGKRLILNFSETRAKKDAANREKGITRLKRNISSGKLTKGSINSRGYNKFLALEGDVTITLDEKRIEEDKAWDGLKGYITNSRMTPEEVVSNYRQLWKIERAFRISKTDLRIRPIYHRKRNRIEAHICVSFVAYTIFKEFERQLAQKQSALSPQRALDIMKTIYQVELYMPDSKKYHRQFTQLTPEQTMLLALDP